MYAMPQQQQQQQKAANFILHRYNSQASREGMVWGTQGKAHLWCLFALSFTSSVVLYHLLWLLKCKTQHVRSAMKACLSQRSPSPCMQRPHNMKVCSS